MPTYTKETALYDTGVISDDIDDASKTATNYISVDATGIRIANANPATATTYQHQTATNTEFVVNNDTLLSLSGTEGITIGSETDGLGQMTLNDDTFKLAVHKNGVERDSFSILLPPGTTDVSAEPIPIPSVPYDISTPYLLIVQRVTVVEDEGGGSYQVIRELAEGTDYEINNRGQSNATVSILTAVESAYLVRVRYIRISTGSAYAQNSPVVQMGSYSTRAFGKNSIAIGSEGLSDQYTISYPTTTIGNYSVAIGESAQASNHYDFAMGNHVMTDTDESRWGQFVLGYYNKNYDPDSIVAGTPRALSILSIPDWLDHYVGVNYAGAANGTAPIAFSIGRGLLVDGMEYVRSNAFVVDTAGLVEAANIHNVMSVYPTNEVTMTGTVQQKVPVRKLHQVGQGFKIVNGFVQCLLDGCISVEGMLSFSGFNTGNVISVIIYRCNDPSEINNANISNVDDKDIAQYNTTRVYDSSGTTRACLTVPKRIFNVDAGTFICIAGGNTSTSTGKILASGNRSYFTLEYV